MLTDTLGLLADTSVVKANMHDTKAGEKVIAEVAKRQKKQAVQTVLADNGFQGIQTLVLSTTQRFFAGTNRLTFCANFSLVWTTALIFRCANGAHRRPAAPLWKQ